MLLNISIITEFGFGDPQRSLDATLKITAGPS